MRINSDKLVKDMVVQMGHDDWRTVTGIEISWKTGNAVYFLDDNPVPYVLDGDVNVQDANPVQRGAWDEGMTPTERQEAIAEEIRRTAARENAGTLPNPWLDPRTANLLGNYTTC